MQKITGLSKSQLFLNDYKLNQAQQKTFENLKKRYLS
jgi:hypothetical protein